MDLLASWQCGCCDIHQAIIWLHSATRLQITTTASVMIDRKMQHQPDGNDIIDMTTAPLLCPHNYNNLKFFTAERRGRTVGEFSGLLDLDYLCRQNYPLETFVGCFRGGGGQTPWITVASHVNVTHG